MDEPDQVVSGVINVDTSQDQVTEIPGYASIFSGPSEPVTGHSTNTTISSKDDLTVVSEVFSERASSGTQPTPAVGAEAINPRVNTGSLAAVSGRLTSKKASSSYCSIRITVEGTLLVPAYHGKKHIIWRWLVNYLHYLHIMVERPCTIACIRTGPLLS